MHKKISDTEALKREAGEATAAGMSYGRYQQFKYANNDQMDRSRLHDMQPIYEKVIKAYICPQCAHPVTPHKNCGHCGKALIWKAGV